MKKKSILSKFSLACTAWKAQFFSNLLFGLPLIWVFLFFEGISFSGIVNILYLYLAIYVFIFIPFYGLLPIFFSRKTRDVLQKIGNKEAVEKEKILTAIQDTLNFPYKITFIVFFTSMAAFLGGIAILSFWLIPNFIFLLQTEVFILAGIIIGFVVSIVHLLLSYIYFENFLKEPLELLVSQISDEEKNKLKFIKIPLFNKILFIIYLSVLSSQLIVASAFLTDVGFNSPEKFISILEYVGIVICITAVFIFIIAANFTKNLISPLQKIIHWTGGVAKGGAEQKLNILTNDEISEVVNYSREMVRELEAGRTIMEIKIQARTRELRELAENLDEQVKGRTKDLQKKIEELERFQRVTVGRELQMIELKKEIAAQKEQIEELLKDQKKQ
jgi:methyl-accepting chemotaxis protein